MNYRFILQIVIILIMNIAISILFQKLIPDYYLARILTSVALSFAFAIIQQWEDRIHFYKYPRFWYTFFIFGILFCLVDLITFVF
ncbi:hypothetical protein DYE49_01360 [Treponema rectale]|uniref:Uncharacterized protein n=1 Tax=Treponema rectale TaxID=744512 RepID=A0A7M1XK57_9SPIR|nr:hypothetical protein DYE49_01360 [Treponema rectale]